VAREGGGGEGEEAERYRKKEGRAIFNRPMRERVKNEKRISPEEESNTKENPITLNLSNRKIKLRGREL